MKQTNKNMKNLRIRFNKNISKFEVYNNITNYMIEIETSFMTKDECRDYIKANK